MTETTGTARGDRSGADAPELALRSLPPGERQAMLAAGAEVLECQRVLLKAGLNVVGEVLKAQGTFYQMKHYPEGDVFDRETHSQYYYHAHRGGEHGHFHLFLRRTGMPPGIRPAEWPTSSQAPSGDDALAHLVAISMDKHGSPIALFTTNRWVTAEAWYAGADVAAMLEHFAIDHAWPSWPTNRWLTAMVKLFRPQILSLIAERDRRIEAWAEEHPESDVLEDRGLEVLSEIRIDVAGQIEALRQIGAGER